jgi:hypothetical protein
VTLILACIVFWQAQEISRVFSQCDPANRFSEGLDTAELGYRRSERGYGAARRIELPGVLAAYWQPEEIPFKAGSLDPTLTRAAPCSPSH